MLGFLQEAAALRGKLSAVLQKPEADGRRPEEAPMTPTKKTTTKAAQEKTGGPKSLTPEGVAGAIDHAIDNIRQKLTTDDLRGSISDLVRLIQLRKELIDEGPKQVTVRWVEEWNNSPANEE